MNLVSTVKSRHGDKRHFFVDETSKTGIVVVENLLSMRVVGEGFDAAIDPDGGPFITRGVFVGNDKAGDYILIDQIATEPLVAGVYPFTNYTQP